MNAGACVRALQVQGSGSALSWHRPWHRRDRIRPIYHRPCRTRAERRHVSGRRGSGDRQRGTNDDLGRSRYLGRFRAQIGVSVGSAGCARVVPASDRPCNGCDTSGTRVAAADGGADVAMSWRSMRSFQMGSRSCIRRAASRDARPMSDRRGLARGDRKSGCSAVSAGFGYRKVRGPSAGDRGSRSFSDDSGPVRCGTSTHGGKVVGGRSSGDALDPACRVDVVKGQLP